MDYHITVCLAAHNEQSLLTPTLRSLARAAEHSARMALTVQLILTLDRSDIYTTAIAETFNYSAFANVHIVHVNYGDLGESRNAAIELANGAYIATADADDLISEAYFTNMYVLASSLRANEFVIFPNYLITFGSTTQIEHFARPTLTTFARLLTQHLFTSRIFAPTKLLQRVPYTSVKLPSGSYAYEDWHLTSSLYIRQIPFHIASQTVLFYRIHNASQMHKAQTTSVRDAPPQLLTLPEIYLAHGIHSSLRNLATYFTPTPTHHNISASDKTFLRTETEAAHNLEPLILPSSYSYKLAQSNLARGSIEAGIAHLHLCYTLGCRTYSTLIFLDATCIPYLSSLTSLLQNQLTLSPHISSTLLLPIDKPSLLALTNDIYNQISIYPLSLFHASLSQDLFHLALIRLIQAYGTEATLYFPASHILQSFLQRFLPALTNNPLRQCGDWGPE